MNSLFQWQGNLNPQVPLFLTAPHSGEQIPPEATWLNEIDTHVLLTDVDRFVDELYSPAAKELSIPLLSTSVHRYAVDLNRYPTDFDLDAVLGSANASGTFAQGIHWVRTTRGAPLISRPMETSVHQELIRLYHDAFHEQIRLKIGEIRLGAPFKLSGAIFHLDCHSMPSKGTGAHRDSGQTRPDVVISDQNGTSCSGLFKDLIVDSFKIAGFSVGYNWPYLGGRITQRYGNPSQGHHTLQIELNRSLYMDEVSKSKTSGFGDLQLKLKSVLSSVASTLAISAKNV